MKKVFKSLLLIGLVSLVGYGASRAYFTDEKSVLGNTVTTGTIKIDLKDRDGLQSAVPLTVADMKPSTVHYLQLVVHNAGNNAADVWKKLTGFSYLPGQDPDSCIGGVIRYDMEINGRSLIRESDGYVLDTCNHMAPGAAAPVVPVADRWMYLGRIQPNEDMKVDQSYHMDSTTDNWAQGRNMTFNASFFAQQIIGGAPSQNPELSGHERCTSQNNYGVVESYNIGTADDSGHGLLGWSNVWDWGGNYGGGDDGSLRLLMGPGDPLTCDAGAEPAEFTMHAGTQYAVQLSLRHLDGSQDDSFDVYAKIGGVWTKFGHYDGTATGEHWLTSTFNLPVPLTGDVEFKLVATRPATQWCQTWGQVAFSLAKLRIASCPNPLD